MSKIAVDCETSGLEWFEPDQQAFLTTWSDERGNDHLAHQDDARAMAAFESDARGADALVLHNAAFDVHQLRATSGIDLLSFGKRIVDTSTLARVVVPERRAKQHEDDDASTAGFKLKDLAATYVDPDAKDSETLMAEAAKAHGIKLKAKYGYRLTWEVEPELVEDYAKMDTRLTIELLPKLAARITDKLRATWELERDVGPHLIRAEARGIAIDQDKVQPLKAGYLVKRDEAYAAAVAVLGEDAIADPGDPESKDDSEALCEALLDHGVPLHRKVKSCRCTASCDCPLTTNKFALQEFAADFPVIAELQTYRQASKFLSTYVGPMDGREVVHPSFWPIGAWTGRMSCTRPNLQNIPVRGEGSGELRAMFVPRPGHVFVVSDYDAIEIRLLAYYLNSPVYKGMIEGGLDPHAWMASNIWGGDASGYLKGGPNDKLRSAAKNILFAIVYGAGAPRVMDMLADAEMACTRDDAKVLIRAIKSALPGYWKLNSRVRKKVEAQGHVNTIWGRRQPVNKDKAYIGLSGIIQGSAADVFKQGVINAAEATTHLGALPVLFAHDELVTECPVDAAEECRALQDQAMRDAHGLSPALEVTSCIAVESYAAAK